MGDNTKIEWADATWNPTVGCTIISPGCTNCYAMKMAERLESMASKPDGSGNFHLDHYRGTTSRGPYNRKPVHWTGVVKVAPESTLLAPLKWKKPRRIFVNSMSDLFHESVPDEVIDKVFAVMALCPQHTFQILTKRSKRMREYCSHIDFLPPIVLPLSNVHLGVSCEDQTRADERIPDLLATPAAVRFVSAEPLLLPLNLEKWLEPWTCADCGFHGGVNDQGPSGCSNCGCEKAFESPDGFLLMTCRECGSDDQAEEPSCPNCGSHRSYKIDCGFKFEFPYPTLDQIIVGGESGHGHRPMQMESAEDIMRQCRETGTAFFFKQDSGPRSGMRGRASDELWACKQMPEVK